MLKQGLMLAAATLALAACNGRSAEQTAGDTTAAAGNTLDATGSAMANAAAEMAPASAMATPTAAEFVQRMAISDMYEIEFEQARPVALEIEGRPRLRQADGDGS